MQITRLVTKSPLCHPREGGDPSFSCFNKFFIQRKVKTAVALTILKNRLGCVNNL